MYKCFIVVSTILSCLFFFNCSNLITENPTTGTIQGRVTSAEGDVAIAGAIVTAVPVTASENTNSQGEYIITGVAPGQYTITAAKTGYNFGSVTILVEAGQTVTADIRLYYFNQNSPPNTPMLISPLNGSVNVLRNITLHWSCSDPDGDTLVYDVYFGKINPPTTVVSSNQRSTTIAQTGLDSLSTYYWGIVAKDNRGAEVSGSVWKFTTGYDFFLHEGMVLISASGQSFQMGSNDASFPIEQPVHTVSFTHNFYMDTSEVTQADYSSVMGVNPSYFTGDTNRPAEEVTWFDAVLYCNARSKRDGMDTVYSYSSLSGIPGNGCTGLGNLVITLARNGYRLPTEAEWEYACRAGSTADYYWGGSYPPATAADTAAVDTNAVWLQNSNNSTTSVGTKQPNAMGLYDMCGNVWEWCNDWYANYDSNSQTDPAGPASGSYRVLRGGSWLSDSYSLRSAYRGGLNPVSRSYENGFRCVRVR
jgi:formylglycine-generating enzyme required for sulfatase activity